MTRHFLCPGGRTTPQGLTPGEGGPGSLPVRGAPPGTETQLRATSASRWCLQPPAPGPCPGAEGSRGKFLLGKLNTLGETNQETTQDLAGVPRGSGLARMTIGRVKAADLVKPGQDRRPGSPRGETVESVQSRQERDANTGPKGSWAAGSDGHSGARDRPRVTEDTSVSPQGGGQPSWQWVPRIAVSRTWWPSPEPVSRHGGAGLAWKPAKGR